MKIAIWLCVIALIEGENCLWGQKNSFSVMDSVEMIHFSDPSDRARDVLVRMSPDGRYFLVVTSRTVVESDEVESTIWVFESAAIHASLLNKQKPVSAPRALARWTGVPPGWINSYFPVITDVQWTSDSSAIYFLGYTAATERRLCEVTVADGRLRILTPPESDVEVYSEAGGTVAYRASRFNAQNSTTSQTPGAPINGVAGAITGMSISDILFPGSANHNRRNSHDLWFIRKGQTRLVQSPPSQPTAPDADRYWDFLALSPDGEKAVQLRPIIHAPASWSAFVPKAGFEDWQREYLVSTNPNRFLLPSQYELIDLGNGKATPLVDAPYAGVLAYLDPASAVWGPSGNRLLLTGTFLPLEVANPAEAEKRLHPCAVASVDLQPHEARCIVYSRDAVAPTANHPRPLRLVKARFGANENEVLLSFAWHDEVNQTEWYRYESGQWKLQNTVIANSSPAEPPVDSSQRAHGLTMRIQQGMNDPPALWATDGATGKSREIWNPNPQLMSISYGSASVYHWKDKTGYEWTGGLILPLNYVPGNRYPLVIQTHGFQDFEFITDGAYPTAMAARPLASAGLIVLQVAPNGTHVGQLREATDNVLGFGSAIDQLTADGLIDPKRVGIAGFSRTSWYVEHALIDDPDRFAAASIADGTDQSYMQEILFEPEWNTSEPRKLYGAAPFGDGLKRWLELAPSFHLNEIHAPLIITAIAPRSVLEEWEIYSSLYQQNKPVDLIYIPKGQHILQRPLERLASEQVMVDWFRFWLQDYEDPDPKKRAQFLRWEGIKNLRVQPLEKNTMIDANGN